MTGIAVFAAFGSNVGACLPGKRWITGLTGNSGPIPRNLFGAISSLGPIDRARWQGFLRGPGGLQGPFLPAGIGLDDPGL